MSQFTERIISEDTISIFSEVLKCSYFYLTKSMSLIRDSSGVKIKSAFIYNLRTMKPQN